MALIALSAVRRGTSTRQTGGISLRTNEILVMNWDVVAGTPLETIYRPQLDLASDCERSAADVLSPIKEEVERAIAGDR